MVDCDTQIAPAPGQPDWTNVVASIYSLGGLESEKAYPPHHRARDNRSEQRQRRCHFNESRIVAFAENGYYLVLGESSVAAVMAERGPLAVEMNAAPRSFQFYSSGKKTVI